MWSDLGKGPLTQWTTIYDGATKLYLSHLQLHSVGLQNLSTLNSKIHNKIEIWRNDAPLPYICHPWHLRLILSCCRRFSYYVCMCLFQPITHIITFLYSPMLTLQFVINYTGTSPSSHADLLEYPYILYILLSTPYCIQKVKALITESPEQQISSLALLQTLVCSPCLPRSKKNDISYPGMWEMHNYFSGVIVLCQSVNLDLIFMHGSFPISFRARVFRQRMRSSSSTRGPLLANTTLTVLRFFGLLIDNYEGLLGALFMHCSYVLLTSLLVYPASMLSLSIISHFLAR